MFLLFLYGAAYVDPDENYETGDASLDDPLNQDEIGDTELLVVSFGTSYNDSRRETIGRVAFCACRRSDPPQAENSAKQEFFLFSGEVFLFDDLNRHILASPQFEGSSSLV